jgi:hypothetical protein
MKHYYARFEYGTTKRVETIVCLNDITHIEKGANAIYIYYRTETNFYTYPFNNEYETNKVFNKIWEMLVKEWK